MSDNNFDFACNGAWAAFTDELATFIGALRDNDALLIGDGIEGADTESHCLQIEAWAADMVRIELQRPTEDSAQFRVAYNRAFGDLAAKRIVRLMREDWNTVHPAFLTALPLGSAVTFEFHSTAMDFEATVDLEAGTVAAISTAPKAVPIEHPARRGRQMELFTDPATPSLFDDPS